MYCLIQDTDGIQDLYFALENKTIIIGSGSNLPEGFDPTVRSWYVDAKATGGRIFTAPYINASDGVEAMGATTEVFTGMKDQTNEVGSSMIHLSTTLDDLQFTVISPVWTIPSGAHLLGRLILSYIHIINA